MQTTVSLLQNDWIVKWRLALYSCINYAERSTYFASLDNKWKIFHFFQTPSTLQGVPHHEVHFLLPNGQLRT
jgi:hypothetical protein